MRSGWNLLWVVSILGVPLQALADEVGTWDLDGDNYTSCDAPVAVLEALPEGQACDCDDADSQRNPAAVEVPYNGKDENCDFKNDFDGDGDGYEDATVRQQYFTDNALEERTCGSAEHLAEPWLGCENPSAMGVDIVDCDDTEDGVHTAILSAGDEQLVKLLREDWALSQSSDKLVFLSNDEEDADYYSVDETLSDPEIVSRWNAIASSFEQDRDCVASNQIRDAQGEDPQTCRQYLYSAPETCEIGALVDNDCSAQEGENRSPGVNTTRTCKLDIRAWAEAQLDIPNGQLMLGDYVACDQALNEGWYFRNRRDSAGLSTITLDSCFVDALESYPGYVQGAEPGDLGFRYGPESLGNVIAAVPVRSGIRTFYTAASDGSCGLVASDFNSTAEFYQTLVNRCVGIAGDYFLLDSTLSDLDPLAVRFSVCVDHTVSSSSGGDAAALTFSNMTDFLWGVGWSADGDLPAYIALGGYEDQDVGIGDGAGVDDRQAGYTCDPDEDNFSWINNRLDCDDRNPSINLNALEQCDGQDNNCNGFVDEPDVNMWMTERFDSVGSGGNWHARDEDADGFGIVLDNEMKSSDDPMLEVRDAIYYCSNYLECNPGEECPGRCGPNNEGYVEGNYCFLPERAERDCYDFDPQIYPRWGTEGSSASEAPIQRFDGKDNNCDDTIALYELDCDGDGYFPIPAGLDLDSVDPSELLTSTFTEPSEIGLTRCDEGGAEAEAPVFECNGQTLAPFCSPEGFWVVDNEALAEVFPDRYANGFQVMPEGLVPYMLDGFDCDDQDSSISPAADDIPDDGIDNDCDGSDSVAPPATPEVPAEDDPAPLEEDPASCGGCSQPVAPSGGLLLLGLLGAIRRRRA